MTAPAGKPAADRQEGRSVPPDGLGAVLLSWGPSCCPSAPALQPEEAQPPWPARGWMRGSDPGDEALALPPGRLPGLQPCWPGQGSAARGRRGTMDTSHSFTSSCSPGSGPPPLLSYVLQEIGPGKVLAGSCHVAQTESKKPVGPSGEGVGEEPFFRDSSSMAGCWWLSLHLRWSAPLTLAKEGSPPQVTGRG